MPPRTETNYIIDTLMEISHMYIGWIYNFNHINIIFSQIKMFSFKEVLLKSSLLVFCMQWWCRTLCILSFDKTSNKYICISLFKTEIPKVLWRLDFKTKKKHPISLSQYYGCWWPGDTRSQGINSHCIDLVLPKYSGFSTRRLTSGDTGNDSFQQLWLL